MYKVKLAAIYKISVGEYYYIGKSVDFCSRWSSHLTQLVMGTHHSPELQELYNTKGLTSFRFEVLEIVSLSLYKNQTSLKGKELEKSFNRLLLDKEKSWMRLYSINYCLNKDKKYFQ